MPADRAPGVTSDPDDILSPPEFEPVVSLPPEPARDAYAELVALPGAPGPKSWPCCWCATPVPSETAYCPACGHNAASVRACGCDTCTKRAGSVALHRHRPRPAGELVLIDDAGTFKGPPGSEAPFGGRDRVMVRRPEELARLVRKAVALGISVTFRPVAGEAGRG